MLSNYDLNRLFDGAFNNTASRIWVSSYGNNKEVEESFEINETKDGAYLFLEAPGFNKSNLKVEMENGTLYVEGKRTYKLNGEEVSRTISKKFKIGQGYQSESVEATIEDGLLTVFVPNMKKSEKKRISLL